MKRPIALAFMALVTMPLFAATDELRQPADGSANLLFTLTIVDTEDGGATTRRAVRVIALDGRRTQLKAGWRLPIPTTTHGRTSKAGEITPVTSFSYQDVGLSLQLEGRTVGEGRIQVVGRIEVSSLAEGGDGPLASTPPRVGTFSHEVAVTLTDRVETTLAEVPKPGGGSMTLAIAATIQE